MSSGTLATSRWYAVALFGAPSLSSALSPVHAQEREPITWSFEADAADKPPAGFRFWSDRGRPPGALVLSRRKGRAQRHECPRSADADATSFRSPVTVASASKARRGMRRLRMPATWGLDESGFGYAV